MIVNLTLNQNEIKKALRRYVESQGYIIASEKEHTLGTCHIRHMESERASGVNHYYAEVVVESEEKEK